MLSEESVCARVSSIVPLIQLVYKSDRYVSVTQMNIFICLICLVERSGGLNMRISRNYVLIKVNNKFVGGIWCLYLPAACTFLKYFLL